MIFGIPELVFGLIVGILAGGALELSILWFAGRRWIPNRSVEVYNKKAAAGDLDDARDHFIAPMKEELTQSRVRMEVMITEELAGFETRFSEAYKADMQAISEDMNRIPERIKMTALSERGVEEKAFRKMVEEAETEIDGEISVMEAVAAQNPEMMNAAIVQKIQKLGSDEEWQKKHQIGALALEIGKPTLLRWVQEMTRQMQGVPALASGKRGDGGGSVYG